MEKESPAALHGGPTNRERLILVARSELALLLFEPVAREETCLVLTDEAALVPKARGMGFHTTLGDLGDPALYRGVAASAHDRFLIHLLDPADLDRCLAALLEVEPAAAATVLANPDPSQAARWTDDALFLPLPRVGSVCLRSEMERAATHASLTRIRRLFLGAARVLLLLQDDPDPDGLASALALRVLLGRNRQTAVIGSFGAVTRPENLAMIRLLDLSVQPITTESLADYDRLALLDVQPHHSPNIPTEVDLVIDHHPHRTNYTAKIKDVRPWYGATSTMMTEYLLASDAVISPRLATALLYGIKTDTQLLGRDTSPMDVAAFARLYPIANHSLLRRIDRPQLSRSDLGALSSALRNARFEEEVLFTHLGALSREDVVPHIADFCMEIEGVEWAVVSGVYDNRLIASIRAYGTGKNAGGIVQMAFEAYGSAGGHRSAAKAVILLADLPEEQQDLESWVRSRFLAALRTTSDQGD
jgi:nanoRNase/pAp phosphatase (c-di-AMP/oligoRNAs hydrolase)